MAVIALVSPKGGAGKTTLAANLATALAASAPVGERVLAVDLDPQNALRLHHRMAPSDARGLAQCAVADMDLKQGCYEGPYGVDCLPYGVVDNDTRRGFEALLDANPGWLAEKLPAFARKTVLIDTPPGPSAYMQQALMAADIVLVTILADAASFATLTAMQRYLDDFCSDRSKQPIVRHVLNQVDATKPLNRDVTTMLRGSLGARAPLFEIHYDASVEEALACHQPITAYDPNSAAARDLGGIAEWLNKN